MIKIINNIPKDKLLHCLIGVIIFIFFKFLCQSLGNPNILSIALASLLLGAGIEIYQKVFRTGTFEKTDIVATWAGSCLALLAMI